MNRGRPTGPGCHTSVRRVNSGGGAAKTAPKIPKARSRRFFTRPRDHVETARKDSKEPLLRAFGSFGAVRIAPATSARIDSARSVRARVNSAETYRRRGRRRPRRSRRHEAEGFSPGRVVTSRPRRDWKEPLLRAFGSFGAVRIAPATSARIDSARSVRARVNSAEAYRRRGRRRPRRSRRHEAEGFSPGRVLTARPRGETRKSLYFGPSGPSGRSGSRRASEDNEAHGFGARSSATSQRISAARSTSSATVSSPNDSRTIPTFSGRPIAARIADGFVSRSAHAEPVEI